MPIIQRFAVGMFKCAEGVLLYVLWNPHYRGSAWGGKHIWPGEESPATPTFPEGPDVRQAANWMESEPVPAFPMRCADCTVSKRKSLQMSPEQQRRIQAASPEPWRPLGTFTPVITCSACCPHGDGSGQPGVSQQTKEQFSLANSQEKKTQHTPNWCNCMC